MLKKYPVVWFSLGAFLFAQNITKIEYDGLSSLSPTTINEISGISVGKDVSKEQIDRAVKNLLSQGYFQDVSADVQTGGTLVYHFKEKYSIVNVQIDGYGSKDSNEKLIEAMGLKKGDLLDDAKLQRAKAVFQAKLASDGIYDATVDIKTQMAGENGVALTFDVKTGDKVVIREINFSGNEHLSSSDLRSVMTNKEYGWLGWMPFTDRGTAHFDMLENDVMKLREEYAREGYINAQISKPSIKVDSKNNAIIDFSIIEGKRYRVGDVTVNQNVEGLSEKLNNEPRLKKGSWFNIDKMRKDIAFVQEQTANLGYAYAKVEPAFSPDDTNGVVNIQYNVTPGEKVKINDVLIAGNSETKDSVIRRYMYLAPGDLYSQTDLKDSKNALGRTGYFDSYDITPQPLGPDLMNLLVNVKEAPTGSFAIGMGYGSYDKLMFNASLSDRNIFGSGIDAGIGADISAVTKNYNINITNPRLWDSLYSLSLDLHKSQYDYTNYRLNQSGGSLMLGREFWRNFYASVGVAYADNQSDTLSNTAVSDTYKLFYDDKYKKISGLASIKYDNTDDYYLPRSGFTLSLGAELAKLSGTPNQRAQNAGYDSFGDFTKLNAKFGAYYGLEDLINYDLILRYKASATTILSGSGYMPAAERLYLGGVSSLRGYESYSVSPIVDRVGRIGGTWTFSNSVEASIPLSQEAKIRLAFFGDWGIIGSDAYYGQSFSDISRASTGATIEWFSPMGPINFVFSKAINPKAGDRTSSFDFTIGTRF